MKYQNRKRLNNIKKFTREIFKDKNNWIKEFSSRLLKKDFYQNRKNQVIIILIIIAITILSIYISRPKIDKKYYKESIFCQSDDDCELYDCTNCGNKFWIEKKVRNSNCEKTIPGLIGCGCQEGVCKRIYE